MSRKNSMYMRAVITGLFVSSFFNVGCARFGGRGGGNDGGTQAAAGPVVGALGANPGQPATQVGQALAGNTNGDLGSRLGIGNNGNPAAPGGTGSLNPLNLVANPLGSAALPGQVPGGASGPATSAAGAAGAPGAASAVGAAGPAGALVDGARGLLPGGQAPQAFNAPSIGSGPDALSFRGFIETGTGAPAAPGNGGTPTETASSSGNSGTGRADATTSQPDGSVASATPSDTTGDSSLRDSDRDTTASADEASTDVSPAPAPAPARDPRFIATDADEA